MAAVTKNSKMIVLKGGGVLKVLEVDDTLTPVVGATVQDLGYIETTGLSIATSGDGETYDETGAMTFYNQGNHSHKLVGTFQQSNLDLINFIKGADAKQYQLYYKCTETNAMGGKTQELFAVNAVFKVQWDGKAGTKKAPFEISLLPNSASVTIATPHTTFGSAVADVTTVVVAVSDYGYQITETTES